MIKNKTILVLAPHTDDAELGVGGTLHKLHFMNLVHCIAFSICGSNDLKRELFEAAKIIGINNVLGFDFPVRIFDKHRQEILDRMLELKDRINPHIVLLPSINDIHQDHHVIALEGIRAFKNSSILSYEMPWNNFNFNTCAFMELDQDDMEKKIEACEKYKSQQHRPYFNQEFIRSLARIRGTQIGVEYAETMEVIRWIM